MGGVKVILGTEKVEAVGVGGDGGIRDRRQRAKPGSKRKKPLSSKRKGRLERGLKGTWRQKERRDSALIRIPTLGGRRI